MNAHIRGPVWGVECANIGIGTVEIWHGSPDARVRGAPVVIYRKEADEEEMEESESSEYESDNDNSDAGSDGASTMVEAKVKSKESHLYQAVGTCVVTSFIEKSLHPKINTNGNIMSFQ